MSWRYCECGASLYLKTNQHFTMSCRWLYFLETFMELNLCWVNTGISFRLGQARNQYYAGWTKEPILIWVNQGIHVKLGQPEKTFYIRPTRDPISDWANQGTHFRLGQPRNPFYVLSTREPIFGWANQGTPFRLGQSGNPYQFERTSSMGGLNIWLRGLRATAAPPVPRCHHL